ncbi:hypothetical protein H0H81_008367 [Sphagnurus paluster]|uniref:Uncharacterized protein n=1 Tax=Sphagnurus paluster TaxID=117069 RepID=A0A9P7K4P9_9AGAR|nr:hypothetical protein H0H81_008367 [Sphagnurus paluster]
MPRNQQYPSAQESYSQGQPYTPTPPAKRYTHPVPNRSPRDPACLEGGVVHLIDYPTAGATSVGAHVYPHTQPNGMRCLIMPRRDVHSGEPSFPSIRFTIAGAPGPTLGAVVRGHMRLDRPNDHVLADRASWSRVRCQVDWPGAEHTPVNIHALDTNGKPLTREQLANEVTAILYRFFTANPQIISSQKTPWKEVRLIALSYYRHTLVPTAAGSRRPPSPNTYNIIDVQFQLALTDPYTGAFTDFFGLPSNPRCIFKTGNPWRVRTGPQAWRILREARPVCDHPIRPRWLEIGQLISEHLDSRDLEWTSVDPVTGPLIELYRDKMDWNTFPGNKVYVGSEFHTSPADLIHKMHPHLEGRSNFEYPYGEVLPVKGFAKHEEIRNPQQLDSNGEKCLIVLKNGKTTGPTFGRLSSLESFKDVAFSTPGDSGSIAVDWKGRIVGLLVAGAGTTKETDVKYLTPYWWIEEQIKKVYPDTSLYEPVDSE